MQGTVENLNLLQKIVWGEKQFTMLTILKYKHFTQKIERTNLLLVFPLWFLVFFAVFNLLCHPCYLSYNKKS